MTVYTVPALHWFLWPQLWSLTPIHPGRLCMSTQRQTATTSLASPHTHNSGQSPGCFMMGQAHHNSMWWGRWKNSSRDQKTRGTQLEKISIAAKERGKSLGAVHRGHPTGPFNMFLRLFMTNWTKLPQDNSGWRQGDTILTIIGKVGPILKDHNRRKLWQSYWLLKTHKIILIQNQVPYIIFTLWMYLHLPNVGQDCWQQSFAANGETYTVLHNAKTACRPGVCMCKCGRTTKRMQLFTLI